MEEIVVISSKNPVDEAVVHGVLEVLVLCIMVQVIKETRVIDDVYVDMSMGFQKGFSEEGAVLLDVCSVDGIEIFRLITGFRDG